jgi:glutathione peroxidase
MRQMSLVLAGKGLVVLGVPANQFGNQEPGTDVEISKFRTTEDGGKFLMLSKVSACSRSALSWPL